jgi:hypothetical protein
MAERIVGGMIAGPMLPGHAPTGDESPAWNYGKPDESGSCAEMADDRTAARPRRRTSCGSSGEFIRSGWRLVHAGIEGESAQADFALFQPRFQPPG